MDDEDDWFGGDDPGRKLSYSALSLIGDEEARISQRRTTWTISALLLCAVAGLVFWILSFEPDDPEGQRKAEAAVAEQKAAAAKAAALKPLVADLDAALAANRLTSEDKADTTTAAHLIRALTPFAPDPLPTATYDAYLKRIADALAATAAQAEASFSDPSGYVLNGALKGLFSPLMDLSNGLAKVLPEDADAFQRAFVLSANASMSGIWHTAQMGSVFSYYTHKIHQKNLEALKGAIQHWEAVAALPSLPAGPANEQLKRLRALHEVLVKESRTLTPRWRFVGLRAAQPPTDAPPETPPTETPPSETPPTETPPSTPPQPGNAP